MNDRIRILSVAVCLMKSLKASAVNADFFEYPVIVSNELLAISFELRIARVTLRH